MRLRVFSVFALLFLLVGTEVTLARGSSSSRSSSSSFRSSSSRSSSSSSFSSKPKVTPTTTSNTRKSTTTFGKKETSTQPPATTPTKTAVSSTTPKTTPKAVAPSKVSKEVKQRNAASVKKYGKGEQGRQNAIADYRKEQASKVTQRWDSEPSVRPNYVPNTVPYNGSNVNVVFSNGGYGYYVGSAWTPLDYAMYMAVTDDMLYHRGYGNYGTYNTVHHSYAGGHVLLTIIGSIIVLVIIVGIVVAVTRS